MHSPSPNHEKPFRLTFRRVGSNREHTHFHLRAKSRSHFASRSSTTNAADGGWGGGGACEVGGAWEGPIRRSLDRRIGELAGASRRIAGDLLEPWVVGAGLPPGGAEPSGELGGPARLTWRGGPPHRSSCLRRWLRAGPVLSFARTAGRRLGPSAAARGNARAGARSVSWPAPRPDGLRCRPVGPRGRIERVHAGVVEGPVTAPHKAQPDACPAPQIASTSVQECVLWLRRHVARRWPNGDFLRRGAASLPPHRPPRPAVGQRAHHAGARGRPLCCPRCWRRPWGDKRSPSCSPRRPGVRRGCASPCEALRVGSAAADAWRTVGGASPPEGVGRCATRLVPAEAASRAR